MLRRPFLKRSPNTRTLAITRANLELVNRVDLPERKPFRIARPDLSVFARTVARIEQKLPRDADRGVRPGQLVNVLCRPLRGPVMGTHFGHDAVAFVRFRTDRHN